MSNKIFSYPREVQNRSALNYSSNNERDLGLSLLLPNSTNTPVRDLVVIPGNNVEQHLDALNAASTVLEVSRNAIGGSKGAAWILERTVVERERYMQTIKNELVPLWESLGKKVTPEVTRRIVAARTDVRNRMRSLSAWNFGTYQIMDVVQLRDLKTNARLLSTINASEQQLLATINSAIESVRPSLGKGFVVAARPVSRALTSMSYVAVGIEVPVAFYKIYTAKSEKEIHSALAEAAIPIAYSGLTYSLCYVSLLGGPITGFIGCGVIPIATGFFVGDAAKKASEWVSAQEKSLF